MAKTTENTIATEQLEKPVSGGYIEAAIPHKHGKFVIVAVQNNTDIHPAFWPLVKEFAIENKCEILAAPILYNKNAWAQPDDIDNKGLWFAPEIREFMQDERIILNDSVLYVGNAHVLPTAKNPLSGFQAISSGCANVVIPASKIALECMPAMKGEKGRILQSTGTVTLCNYIARKVGVAAETEHNFGFVIVEPGKIPRSVEFKKGGFYDFDGEDVAGYGYCENTEPGTILTLGDIHAEKCGYGRREVMFNIVQAVQPSYINLHDLLDFTSRNHHNRENPFFKFSQDLQGHSVFSDVEKAHKFLKDIGMDDGYVINIVESNHDLALDRWLNEADWRDDTVNAVSFLQIAMGKIKSIQRGESFNAFGYAMNEWFGLPFTVRFNGTDIPLQYHGIEHGNHGDKGPNGARGSIQAFRKIGRDMVIGHSHTPGIAGGVYQVGVGGDLDMGYNCGPSSWRNAHCLTFSNGQRQLIIEA
jgi:hypothetical protein